MFRPIKYLDEIKQHLEQIENKMDDLSKNSQPPTASTYNETNHTQELDPFLQPTKDLYSALCFTLFGFSIFISLLVCARFCVFFYAATRSFQYVFLIIFCWITLVISLFVFASVCTSNISQTNTQQRKFFLALVGISFIIGVGIGLCTVSNPNIPDFFETIALSSLLIVTSIYLLNIGLKIKKADTYTLKKPMVHTYVSSLLTLVAIIASITICNT